MPTSVQFIESSSLAFRSPPSHKLHHVLGSIVNPCNIIKSSIFFFKKTPEHGFLGILLTGDSSSSDCRIILHYPKLCICFSQANLFW